MTTKKAILCVMIAASLTACGVKPKHVLPPSGGNDQYPAVYPYPDKDQLEYDRQMGKLSGERLNAEKAAKQAEEDARNKPDWSVR